MSDHAPQPYADMIQIAELLVAKLAPACERIEIAGSLRRQKPYCSDIEIVAIPKPVLNLLGEPSEYTELDALLDNFPLTFTKRGRKMQQFWFDGATMPFYVDLFLPDADTWGVVYMMRTGCPAFSKKMVTRQAWGGYKPDIYEVDNARVWQNGTALATPEEEIIFDLWGMNWIAPQKRVAA